MADTATEPVRVSTRQRKTLIEKIALLTETEHFEIYKMLSHVLKDGDVSCTKNRNGMFINFKKIPTALVLDIEKFVDFCNHNRQNLDEYDKCINECKLHKDISKVFTLHQQAKSMNDDENDDINADINASCNALQDVITRENRNHFNKSQWLDLLKESKEKQRVTQFVDALENNFAKIHKKKTCNMKYANAKKKYARKVAPEKKFDADLVSNLEVEQYLCNRL